MDWSRLPEPLRSRLQEQLERLPPEVRGKLEASLAKVPVDDLEKVLAKSAPMLERLAGKQGGKGPSSAGAKSVGRPKSTGPSGSGLPAHAHRRYDPHNHYNSTIRRGDSASPPFFEVLLVVAAALVFLRALGFG
jgi:hypothetical protein